MKSSAKPGNSVASEPNVAPGLGVGPLPSRAHEGVRRIVTLGTPHLGPTSGRDMTGGTLTWLNTQWPGGWLSSNCLHVTGRHTDSGPSISKHLFLYSLYTLVQSDRSSILQVLVSRIRAFSTLA